MACTGCVPTLLIGAGSHWLKATWGLGISGEGPLPRPRNPSTRQPLVPRRPGFGGRSATVFPGVLPLPLSCWIRLTTSLPSDSLTTMPSLSDCPTAAVRLPAELLCVPLEWSICAILWIQMPRLKRCALVPGRSGFRWAKRRCHCLAVVYSYSEDPKNSLSSQLAPSSALERSGSLANGISLMFLSKGSFKDPRNSLSLSRPIAWPMLQCWALTGKLR